MKFNILKEIDNMANFKFLSYNKFILGEDNKVFEVYKTIKKLFEYMTEYSEKYNHCL